jgi:hypothetical protein
MIPTAACIQKPSHPRRENAAERLSFGDGRKAFCNVRNTSEFLNGALLAMLPNDVDQVSLAFGAIVTSRESRLA